MRSGRRPVRAPRARLVFICQHLVQPPCPEAYARGPIERHDGRGSTECRTGHSGPSLARSWAWNGSLSSVGTRGLSWSANAGPHSMVPGSSPSISTRASRTRVTSSGAVSSRCRSRPRRLRAAFAEPTCFTSSWYRRRFDVPPWRGADRVAALWRGGLSRHRVGQRPARRNARRRLHPLHLRYLAALAGASVGRTCRPRRR